MGEQGGVLLRLLLRDDLRLLERGIVVVEANLRVLAVAEPKSGGYDKDDDQALMVDEPSPDKPRSRSRNRCCGCHKNTPSTL